jgi:ribosomal protein S27E
MDQFIELLKNEFILIPLCAIAIFILLIVLVAFIQGREVSFWPPKIGAKPQSPKSEVGQSSTKSKKNVIYEKLSIHCGSCGNEILVTNPRPGQYPNEIHVDVSSASRGGTSDYLRTGCPNCKHTQMVSLRYSAK